MSPQVQVIMMIRSTEGARELYHEVVFLSISGCSVTYHAESIGRALQTYTP